MKNQIRQKSTVLTVLAIALGGTLTILDRSGVLADPWLIGMASAQDTHDSGGHDSGGGSGGSGGHSGGSGSSGGHSGGSGGSGGHDSGGGSSGGGGCGGGGCGGGSGGSGHSGGSGGSGHSGGEAKGHGTKYKHQGHGGGQHGVASSHEAGGDRFGGGSGLHGNNQVPEGIGRYGQGHAELPDGAVSTGGFRYWGGWTLPEEPGTPTTTTPTDSDLASVSGLTPGPGGGQSVNVRSVLDTPPRCDGISAGMPAGRQFGGSNLLRLTAARGLVDPELAASGKIASPYIMGSLQNELIKPAPNIELAGTYLGLVAKAPVSADAVKKIGHQLCAGVSDSQAKEIAQVAEKQRVALTESKAEK